MRHLIETPRLRLRELHPSDLDFVAGLRSDPEVMRFYPKVFTRADSAAWLDRQLERVRQDGHGFWLVISRDSQVPLGTVGVVTQIVDEQSLIEVGYMLAAKYWRQGYATEAARACRDWAFGHLDIDAVHSLIRPENLASQGVARNNGMQPVRKVTFHGMEHDLWRITRDEWMQRAETS